MQTPNQKPELQTTIFANLVSNLASFLSGMEQLFWKVLGTLCFVICCIWAALAEEVRESLLFSWGSFTKRKGTHKVPLSGPELRYGLVH